MSDTSEPKEKRKRQRLSLVCTHCKKRKIKCDKAKPTCSNCLKFGVNCHYELPHWVNSSVQEKTITTNITISDDYNHKSRDELLYEIEALKSKLSKSSPNTPSTNQLSSSSLYNLSTDGYFNSYTDFGDHNDDIIDLYESYNTLAMKHSSHEEHKPLNPMSISKMDPYMSFFSCYLFLSIKMTPTSVVEMFKETWKSKHPDGSSKWILLLDIKYKDSELKDSIDRISFDRAKLFQSNIFPFLNMQDSKNEEVEFLTKAIEETLPSKSYAENFLDFFFHFIWMSRPFIDELTFKADVSRIISFDNETKRPKIKFSQRSDFATIATLLIILRYSSVAVSVIDAKDQPSFLEPLKKNPVSIRAISVAQLCLSMYKVLKKTTIHMIQALLYLRCYLKDSPEDGDGLTLGQSQLLFGFIVQSAITMGLHRDSANYSQVSNDMKEFNLRRRLWHCIVSLDCETSVLSGTLPVLPDKSFVNVKLPVLTSVDSVEQSQLEELEKNAPLLEMYYKFVHDINNMQQKPTLITLMHSMEQIRAYIDKNYSMKNLTILRGLNCGTRVFRAALFANLKTMEKQLIQLSLETTFYYGLCCYYETNAHLNQELYKTFFQKTLQSTAAILDITGAYLSGAFAEYYTPAHTNFAAYPMMITACFRSVNTLTAMLLRAYHAQELIRSKLYPTNTQMNEESLEQLIIPISKRIEDYLFLNKKRFAMKYYQPLKILGCGRYSYVALKKNKFRLMNKIIKFLESDEKGSIGEDIFLNGTKRDEIKKHFQTNKSLINVQAAWMQLNNSDSWGSGRRNADDEPEDETIMNINNSNVYLDFTEQDISTYSKILTESFYFCDIPQNVDNQVTKEFLSSSTESTPNDVLSEDIYNRMFNDNDFNSQISNLFRSKPSNFAQNDDVTEGVFGELFDQIMGTTATVDDVFLFQ